MYGVRDWPQLLSYALWVDRTTHSLVTGFIECNILVPNMMLMSKCHNNVHKLCGPQKESKFSLVHFYYLENTQLWVISQDKPRLIEKV